MIRLTDHPDKTVAADRDVKQQNTKLFVGIHHVSYHPSISNEMSLIGPVHLSCWKVFVMFIQISIEHYLANSGDPDQTANHAASDLDHHC